MLVCSCLFSHFFHVLKKQVIRNHPSSVEIYQNKLLELGVITKEGIEAIHNKVNSILNEEFINSKDYVTNRRDWLSAYWTGFKSPEQISRIRNTGYECMMKISFYKFVIRTLLSFKPFFVILQC